MKIALTATPSVARFAPILWRGHVQAAFELAAELGYDGVELHLRSPEDIEPEAVRALQEKHGLGVPTIGTGMAAGETTLKGITINETSNLNVSGQICCFVAGLWDVTN